LLVTCVVVLGCGCGSGSEGGACWGDEGGEDWGEVGVQEGGDLGLDGWRGVEGCVFGFWDLGLGLDGLGWLESLHLRLRPLAW
jgi:hypothetical protein